MAKNAKITQISEKDPKKLMELAKENVRENNETKHIMWVLERSQYWRAKGYSELKKVI